MTADRSLTPSSLGRLVGKTPTDQADLDRMERNAWLEQGIALVRTPTEHNKILKRLAEDRAASRFGPRPETKDVTHGTR